MVLYLVRHGEPDYSTDTLTVDGHRQAELCSERFKISGLDKIFSSPMGRAVQTAEHTASKLNLDINIEPWAYELGDESKTYYPDGNFKTLSVLPGSFVHGSNFVKQTVDESIDTLDKFVDNNFKSRYYDISNGLDDFLCRLGYQRRKDGLYDVIMQNNERVALFCHCAMQRVILSHLFHIPYNFYATTLLSHYTGITIIYFKNDTENPVLPVLSSYGDIGHLYNDKNPINHYYFHKDI